MWVSLSSGQGEAASPPVAGEAASVRSVAGGQPLPVADLDRQPERRQGRDSAQTAEPVHD